MGRIGRTFQRKKRGFKTARAAWMDIGRKTRIKPSQVKKEHTSRLWKWKVVK